jgi:hypothetical protein
MQKLQDESAQSNDDVLGHGHVPIALSSIDRKRTIGTAPPGGHDQRAECTRGIGSLLGDRSDERHGRDLQLRCKRKNCEVCGPLNKARKTAHILSDFGVSTMHSIEVEDGGKEWEALSKRLVRSGADYHRIPAPNHKIVVMTTADIGEAVPDPESFVHEALEAQPCDSNDTRRATSSSNWKGAGNRSNGRWKRLGTSPLPQATRLRIYAEEGCDPVEVSEDDLGPDVVAAHDVSLPPHDTAEMDRLSDRLSLTTDDQRPLGPGGWPQPHHRPSGRSEDQGGFKG